MKNHDDIEKLEKLIGQLNGLHSEISILAKKAPSDALNLFKLRLINTVIQSGNAVLGTEYLPFEDFKGFESEDVPSNSDVALVLSQYMQEAERYRSDNIQRYGAQWFYFVDGAVTDVRAGVPSKAGRG